MKCDRGRESRIGSGDFIWAPQHLNLARDFKILLVFRLTTVLCEFNYL